MNMGNIMRLVSLSAYRPNRFYIWFKYLLVTPVIIMAIPLLLLRKPVIA